jgi:hypothetical protein
MELSRNDIISALGPLDDSLIAQIIATGATREELTEARAWIENDEAMMNIGRPLAGGRVAQLVDILGRVEEDELDPDLR